MLESIRALPLLVTLALIASLMMAVPAAHAIWLGDFRTASAFLGSGAVCGIIGLMIALTTHRRTFRLDPARQIVWLFLAFVMLPVIMAIPLEAVVPSITFGQAYFEMLSCLTTTGATIFTDPGQLPDPVHLWRGLASWLGGLLIIVAAAAILEPLQLGGFEIRFAVTRTGGEHRRSLGGAHLPSQRLGHYLELIFPVYLALTFALMLALLLAGDRLLVALVHAMSVVSTSGITPLGELSDAPSGRLGEVMIFLFLIAVIIRAGPVMPGRNRIAHVLQNPEFRLASTIVLSFTLLLFARHFIGAIEVRDQDNAPAALAALWGSLFNSVSFLSTTGFVSADWDAAQDYSGLATPGLILLGLCMVGGGIATTAGGVKLLRVYALYKHGVREMQRLIHPNSVGGAGITARRIRKEGAQIAWVFLMLFVLGLSVLLILLTAAGLTFEDALALSIAGITNTGPAAMELNPDISYATLGPVQRALLAGAMIFGRLEALVLVSVFNPAYWRD